MLGIKSRRILVNAKLQNAVVLYENSLIKDILIDAKAPSDIRVEDRGNDLVLPGLIDTHVHINEPGRTDWEGYQTATSAAAAGGVTSLVDMPLNCIPVTTTLRALEEKKSSTKGQLNVDCGFYGGVVPGNAREIELLIKEGVLGFKAFLIESGIPEFKSVSAEDLLKVLPMLAEAKRPLLVHAEVEPSIAPPAPRSESHYLDYLHSRPAEMENKAIELMIGLCEKFKAPIHIVHLSSAGALNSIKKAKERGLPISVETCPHYLCLSAEEIPDGDGRFKCAPPIREKANQEKLWEGLRDGVIDFIVSDHSPCTPKLKHLDDRNLQAAWGGISSLQFVLPLIWTEASRRGFSAAEISKWLSGGPATLVGLQKKKGEIQKGLEADFVIFDSEAPWTLDISKIRYKNALSPYEGRKLKGVVKSTYLRGEKIFDGLQLSPDLRGRFLL